MMLYFSKFIESYCDLIINNSVDTFLDIFIDIK